MLDIITATNREDYEAKECGRSRERETWLRTLNLKEGDFFAGQCASCGRQSQFKVGWHATKNEPLYRGSFGCVQCGMIARWRAMVHMFFAELCESGSKDIYINEQTTPVFKWLSARLPRLIGSEFNGPPGTRHEDWTALTFPTESIDYFLSFEVLEHVPDYVQALRETFRTLRSGGKLILSAPFIKTLPKTLVRAAIDNAGNVTHHEPPDLHGGKHLCFYYFTFDLLDVLREIGFADVLVHEYWSREFVYLGTINQTFITARKP
jgi:SAM-dependent methyltransferase